MEKRFTLSEVAQHNKEDDLWVSYRGEVFDLSTFVEDHPGGKDVLLEHAGRDITEVFHEHHEHSLFAEQLLKDFCIGKLEPVPSPMNNAGRTTEDDEMTLEEKEETAEWKPIADIKKGTEAHSDVQSSEVGSLSSTMKSRRDDKFLDFSKPLMMQVWKSSWSRNYYLEQIHIPRHVTQSPRFFSSSFLEFFTRTPWYAVLFVWVPIGTALALYGAHNLNEGKIWWLHLLVDGFILWTIYEYVFHRFLFHMDNNLLEHKWPQLIHFLVHGVHHLLPMDRYRLVMPPLMMSVFATLVGSMWWWAVGAPTAATLMAGSFAGYLVYDMIHYYSHHGPYLPGYLKRMKIYHLDHHYMDPDRGFGVSNMLWDLLLDTLLPLRVTSRGLFRL